MSDSGYVDNDWTAGDRHCLEKMSWALRPASVSRDNWACVDVDCRKALQSLLSNLYAKCRLQASS